MFLCALVYSRLTYYKNSKNQMGISVILQAVNHIRSKWNYLGSEKKITIQFTWLALFSALSGTSFKKMYSKELLQILTQDGERKFFILLMMLEINFWNLLCKKNIFKFYSRERQKNIQVVIKMLFYARFWTNAELEGKKMFWKINLSKKFSMNSPSKKSGIKGINFFNFITIAVSSLSFDWTAVSETVKINFHLMSCFLS